jgi:putative membrane protein
MTVPPAPSPGPWQHWDLHPSVMIGLALLGGLYVSWGGLQAPRRRIASFAAALAVLGLALNGPLHNLSDSYLFSAHMVQHLVLTLVFPPLLLYGVPASVIRPLLRRRLVFRFARWATRPLIAGALFSVPITLWHFPQFYQAALEHHALHVVQHLVFISTAVIMWWPVLSPSPELPRASYVTQLLYLFALGLPMSVAGALITLADRVLYPFYVSAPRVWDLTPAVDQQLGGLLMWVVGTIYLWVAATVVWFRWAAREEAGDAERAVPLEAYGNAEFGMRNAEWKERTSRTDAT